MIALGANGQWAVLNGYMDIPRHRISAFHEAGHVVAACVLDVQFIRARLFAASQGAHVGGIIFYEDAERRDKARAITALAGAAAAAELCKDWGADVSFWLNQVDYNNFARCTEGMSEEDHYAYWFTWQREASDLVREHWDAIEEIALCLQFLGEIDWQGACQRIDFVETGYSL